MLVSLVALGGGGVYAIASEEPPGIDAPDVVGLGVTAARAEVARACAGRRRPVPKVKVVDRSYSESAPVGVIIAQDPPGGDRIRERGVLLVSVSRGSAYADVPPVAGLEGSAAYALLERRGFTPTPTLCAVDRDRAMARRADRSRRGDESQAPRTRLAARLDGPAEASRAVPRRPGAEDAANVLESAGFSPVVEERADASVPAGTILGVDPAPGTRAPAGSTVTLVVAREPRWESSTSIDSTEDASPPPLVVPAGARLVLSTDDTSPLGLWGGTVDVQLGGDAEGEAEVNAGDTLVLADVSDADRTIEVSLDADGSVHWTLAVQVAR